MAQGSGPHVDQTLAACQAAAGELGECLSRALDATITATIALADAAAEPSAPPAERGLCVSCQVDESRAVLLVPESSGLLPPWCAAPDATGTAKLSTLALELTVLLPEGNPGDCQAKLVDNLAEALATHALPAEALALSLSLSSAAGPNVVVPLHLVRVAPPSPATGEEAKSAAPQPAAAPRSATATVTSAHAPSHAAAASTRPRGLTVSDLPIYARSLLHISVPVVVRLASKRQPVSQITELGPGSIIQFDKSCEDMLDLEVGDQTIARGEAVKVGDKFGIRLTSLVLPDERFKPVRPAR